MSGLHPDPAPFEGRGPAALLRGRSRLVFAGIGLTVAAFYAWAAMGLRLPAFVDPVGPRVVPYLIALGLAVSSLALAVEHFRMRLAGSARFGEGPSLIALLVVGLLALYYAAFQPLGFITATALFLVVLLGITNRGHWLFNVAMAIVFPVGAQLLLGVTLGARLPSGILNLG